MYNLDTHYSCKLTQNVPHLKKYGLKKRPLHKITFMSSFSIKHSYKFLSQLTNNMMYSVCIQSESDPEQRAAISYS